MTLPDVKVDIARLTGERWNRRHTATVLALTLAQLMESVQARRRVPVISP
jgi:hypothetical protein